MSHSTTSGGCTATAARAHQRDQRRRLAQALRAASRAGRPGAPRRCGRVAARAHQRQRQPQLAHHALGLGELGRRHGLEVHALQHLARGEREARVELHLARPRAPRSALRLAEQRVGQPLALLLVGARRCARRSSAAAAASSARVSFGSRQNSAKRLVEDRALLARATSSTADSVQYQSSRRSRPAISSARSAVEHAVGPDAAARRARSTRAKCMTFSASSRPREPDASTRGSISGRGRGALRLGHEAPGLVAGDARDVVLVLEQHAQRVVDGLRVERDACRARPARCVQSMVSATPGSLNRSTRAQPLHEGDDLARQPLGAPRRLAAQDLELARGVGVVDPVVEAAALDRVVDLARAVAR